MTLNPNQPILLFVLIVHLCSSYTRTTNCLAYGECEGRSYNASSGGNIVCHGALSCNACEIDLKSNYSDLYYYGYGAFSLLNASINSGNNCIINITLNGYQAGYGAIMDCTVNSVCKINCISSGCLMVILKGEGTWNINTNSYTTDRPIIDPNLYNDSLLNVDLLNDIIFDENVCNQQQSQWLFDAEKERYEGNDIVYDGGSNSGSICCRGYQSCQGIKNILMQNASTNDAIVCSGYASCRDVSLISNINGPIVCSGYEACKKSNIISNNAIHCSGGWVCRDSNIISDININRNVYCSGDFACFGAVISIWNGGNANLYFLGYRSGYDASIHCAKGASCFIFCGGSESCFFSSLRCDGECTVHCDIDTGCPPGYTATNLPTQSTTAIPTVHPTTAIPTIPTQSTTAIPTVHPTTAIPTIPTQSTTAIPTVHPTKSSEIFERKTTNPSIISTEGLREYSDSSSIEIIYLVIGCCMVLICLCLLGAYKWLKRRQSVDLKMEYVEANRNECNINERVCELLEYIEGNPSAPQQQQEETDGSSQNDNIETNT